MLVRYIYITENAKKLAEKLCFEKLKDEKFNRETLIGEVISYKEFKSNDKSIFDSSDFIIFIMATGIVVRSIANLVKSKFSDPGIIVIDELGKNVISLLSGHIGGANEMTNFISEKIYANPVITTATDINNKSSFDMIIKYTEARIDNMRELCIDINSRLIRNEKIYIFIQEEYRKLLKNTKNGFIIIDEFGKFKNKCQEIKLGSSQERFIIITDRIDYIDCISDILNYKIENVKAKDMQSELVFKLQNKIVSNTKELFMYNESENSYAKSIDEKIIIVIPRKNVLGVGCKRNTDSEKFEKELLFYLKENNISIKSINKIGSIDIKKTEKCILDFAEKYFIKTEFLSKEEISEYDSKYHKSEFVKKIVGVYSVAEPSCHILCEGNLIGKKYKSNGITISVGREI